MGVHCTSAPVMVPLGDITRNSRVVISLVIVEYNHSLIHLDRITNFPWDR